MVPFPSEHGGRGVKSSPDDGVPSGRSSHRGAHLGQRPRRLLSDLVHRRISGQWLYNGEIIATRYLSLIDTINSESMRGDAEEIVGQCTFTLFEA